ncbi:MAG TPA: phosphate ABC transporter ATP-binding protein [Methyloceanibacter sp.]|nr:phosphate ABC transporter ATP-binding protein [Methyloceanibacter sp.]
MASLTLPRRLDPEQGRNAPPFAKIITSPAAFELRNLAVTYGAIPVLRGIDCRISEGAVTAIMGPSGCGKSTLVKTLNRTLELTAGIRVSGEVKFRGQDLYAASIDPRSVRRTLGIIHQRPVPFPMSILENVLFGASFHGRINGEDRIDYARRFLERVSLWEEVKDRLGDRAECLSGGQQQRLCLARTLATKPSALLLDEPCSALDPYATRHIEEHVRDLKRDFPVVIVTHNVAQARRVSDYVLFIYEGELIEAGPTEHVFAAPSSRLARDFISGQFG